ncbi:MAG TPA: glutamine amidotransferase, partial [Lacipirellulaceae bacterium]|nr:glutamine amidotransferase [Lacipirellulaceae bacterium]
MAVVLLSAAAQRALAPRGEPPQSAVRRLAADGIPLYTIAFGQPSLGQQADLRLSDLMASDAVFAETPTTIEAVVAAVGYANREVKVQLLWETPDGEMAAVDTRTVQIVPRKQRYPVQLTHTPRQPGEYKVTVQVESPEGELVTTNNAQSTFITVLKGGVNILFLAGSDRVGGAPGVEPYFIRRALAAHADLNVAYVGLNYSTPQLDFRDRLREERYDVLLLQNVDESALNRPTWQAVAELASQGMGLAMLGGFHSFGPGGFQGSPLENVLPIVMSRAERQTFGETPAADLHVPGPLRMLPIETPDGRVEPMLRIREGPANAALWRELPPLDGANRFDRLRLKPAARVVAEGDDARRSPLAVLGAWGDGRVAALAIDSTWHWQLEGFGDVHRRFWRQLVLWLAKKDETAGERVWVRLDQRRYQQGSRVEFALGAEDQRGAALVDAMFDVRIQRPDGAEVAVPPVRRDAGAAASFADTAAPGDYRITVTARAAGETVGSATARFSVSD